MIELKLGNCTNKEMAEWFGINELTFSKTKTKKLKILEEYCDFIPGRGKITITAIKKSVYEKNKNYRIVEDNFCDTWSPSGLDSCKRVSQQIYDEHYDELTIAESTAYNYTRQARNNLYGKPMISQGGPKGTCKYVWCKSTDNGYEFLTPEEEQIKKDLLKLYFPNTDEKTVTINDMIERKEITESEAWGYYSKLCDLSRSFPAFINAFKQKTGIQLVRGTVLENDAGIFFEKLI